MLLPSLAVVLGIVVVMWSADWLVTGAAATARNLGLAPVVIGITVVGLGTSAPEMLIAVFAAWQGNSGLAIGNALGSNIANIALILGFTAACVPLTLRSGLLRLELPLLLVALAVGLACLVDRRLDALDGVILLVALVLIMGWIARSALRTHTEDPVRHQLEGELPPALSHARALGALLLGLALVLLSSRVLVWGAVTIAEALGVSDLVIGLTIVAIGTSLPELAASLASARKGEHGLAIGNVVGSNIFNSLGVVALPGLIHPGAVADAVLQRDYPIMTALTLALFVMAWSWRGQRRIGRASGLILLACFVGYQTVLFVGARGS